MMSFIWSFVFIFLLLCSSVSTHACHREEEFVKAEGTLSPISPIKTTTVTARAFCSIECTDFSGCNSFAYLTTTNTDNCQLSASPDGESTTAVSVVFKKVPAKSVGCVRNPCLNGGTCEDVCQPPLYYICHCPSDKQGKHCEWDIVCIIEDWTLAFDNPGTYYCAGSINLIAGIERSGCTDITCMEKVKCCPVPIEYSQEDQTCVLGDWFHSFGTHAWNYCPEGYFLDGLERSGGTGLYNIEKGVCCKPPSAPGHWGDCYTEDIEHSFDVQFAQVGCQQPLYYIVGIFTSNCVEIFCMELFRCCRIAITN